MKLSLVPEHRRGHYAVNNGSVDVVWVRVALGALPLPRAADGRIVLALDVCLPPHGTPRTPQFHLVPRQRDGV